MLGGGAFAALWVGMILGYIDADVTDSTKDVILFLPVFVLVMFAFYSIFVIGYRVATFNDCLAAAEELQVDIKEARSDLTKKGFKFD